MSDNARPDHADAPRSGTVLPPNRGRRTGWIVAALIAAGLPTDEFFFAGFLPPRSNARRARLGELQSVPGTLVFYEAPHRLAAT